MINSIHPRQWLILMALLVAAAVGWLRSVELSGSIPYLRSVLPFLAAPTAPLAQLAGLRLPFIANQGQADKRVVFYAPTFAGTVFVTWDGVLVYSLPAKSQRGSLPEADEDETSNVPSGWTLTETFVNGNARPIADDVATANVSYFIGDNPKHWRSHVPSHTKISLGKVWPGIAVHVEAHGHNVEKLFTVWPGANVADIHVRVDGAERLTIAKDGSLAIATGLGDVRLTAPIAYQEKDGTRAEVAVAYTTVDNEYGFVLGTHDPDLPVVIDPLLQSTYIGGGNTDDVYTIAIHPTTGEVYVAGNTRSTNFPGTTGGVQPAFGGGFDDSFVARLDANLTTLIQATYLGGTGGEDGGALVIHPVTNEVYVTGATDSTNFPGTAGGAQPAISGTSDAFVARLNANLTTLIQASYIGGTQFEIGSAITIHPVSGEVYVAGQTSSTNFPGTAGGAQPGSGAFAGNDAFIVRLSADLTVRNQATYLGGNASEQMSNALAIHPTTGEVYAAGTTESTNFPGTTGGAQPAFGGGFNDSFVARLNANLTTLVQATYLGGSDQDQSATGFSLDDGLGRKLIIHPTTGEVYVTGNTISSNFPGTTGGAQSANGGGADVYITRFNAGLTALLQSTYLGTFNADVGNGIAFHPVSGELYIAGSTVFSGFPGTTGGAQPTSGGGVNNAFAARLSADLTTLNQATYLGGSVDDIGFDLAIHPTTSEIYVVGRTSSTDLPATAGGAQVANGGGRDAFITRITADLAAVSSNADLTITKSDSPDPVTVGSNLTYAITVTNNGPAAATAVTVTDALPAGLTFVSSIPSQGSCSVSVLNIVICNLGGIANGANATVTIVVTPGTAGTLNNTATVSATETDSNTANNSATTSTTVTGVEADLAVSVSATPNPVGVNGSLSYSVQVVNNGPLNATGVTLTTNLSGSAFNFVSITPSQGSCAGTTVATCSLGAVANGVSASVNVVVTPTAVGSVTLSAAVSATQPDGSAGNDNAALTVNAVNTVCSNSVQTFVANIVGAQAAGCSATVGPSASGGGGGSLGWVSLLGLVLLGFVRRRIR